jgi:hypothetical protein
MQTHKRLEWGHMRGTQLGMGMKTHRLTVLIVVKIIELVVEGFKC